MAAFSTFLRFLKWKNGWKMEDGKPHGPPARCGVQVVSFFRSAHLHEHKDHVSALRIACCTYTFYGWLQVFTVLAAAGIIKLSRGNYRSLSGSTSFSCVSPCS